MNDSETLSVLIVFSDASLGGTSRSALTFGQAWASRGYRVNFLGTNGIHVDRVPHFQKIGSLMTTFADISGLQVDVVHLHHSVDREKLKKDIKALADALAIANLTPLITNNIFAEPMLAIDEWPSRTLVGVLGPWCVEQYSLRQWYRSRAKPVVIPNPQALDIFREPSNDERNEARRALGIPTEAKVILRTGSPIYAKWSKDYVRLAGLLSNSQFLLLVGAPEKLKSQLHNYSCVITMDLISDDLELRQCYWAADCFALSAKHGESFGNVILEALSCGLPVVYRSTPMSDNTPYDFKFMHGMYIAESSRDWCAQALRLNRSSQSCGQIGIGIVQLFSTETVGHRLHELYLYLHGKQDLKETTELNTSMWQVEHRNTTVRLMQAFSAVFLYPLRLLKRRVYHCLSTD